MTFAHPKQGLLTPAGVVASGVLHAVDLGVPALLGPALTATATLLERADVARHLAELNSKPIEQIVAERRAKFRTIAQIYTEG